MGSRTLLQTAADGTKTTTLLCTYPIDSEELFDMLSKAGFKTIEASPIEEALYVDAYLAFK